VPKNPDLIISKISSETCRVIWLGNSYHMITVDNEREVVANEVIKFIGLSIQKGEMLNHYELESPNLIIKNRHEG
jgi:carboxylesterase